MPARITRENPLRLQSTIDFRQTKEQTLRQTSWILWTVKAYGIAVVAGVLLSVCLLPVCSSGTSRPQSRRTASLSKIKQTVTAINMYAADHSEMYPPAETWMDALVEYMKVGDVLDVDSIPRGEEGGLGLAMNRSVSGKKTSVLASDTVIVFGSLYDRWNGATGAPLLAPVPDTNKALVAFSDGSAKYVPLDAPLNWSGEKR